MPKREKRRYISVSSSSLSVKRTTHMVPVLLLPLREIVLIVDAGIIPDENLNCYSVNNTQYSNTDLLHCYRDGTEVIVVCCSISYVHFYIMELTSCRKRILFKHESHKRVIASLHSQG